MPHDLFADSLTSITVEGGVVRIDFAAYARPDEWNPSPADIAERKKPPLVHRQRLLLTLDAFAQAFSMQEQLMQQLLSTGLLKRNAPAVG